MHDEKRHECRKAKSLIREIQKELSPLVDQKYIFEEFITIEMGENASMFCYLNYYDICAVAREKYIRQATENNFELNELFAKRFCSAPYMLTVDYVRPIFCFEWVDISVNSYLDGDSLVFYYTLTPRRPNASITTHLVEIFGQPTRRIEASSANW
jgi:acyl-CoA thioesterase FadM